MGAVTILVRAVWDSEAGVWVAESPDLPGLIVEADTSEELLGKLDAVIPELIVESGFDTRGLPQIPYCVMSEAVRKVRVATSA
jgi:predicted RNase H-like HicB family nuclease